MLHSNGLTGMIVKQDSRPKKEKYRFPFLHLSFPQKERKVNIIMIVLLIKKPLSRKKLPFLLISIVYKPGNFTDYLKTTSTY